MNSKLLLNNLGQRLNPRFALFFIVMVGSWGAAAFELIAHRGNFPGTVENSLAAIKGAWSVGADAVEIDVRISRDNIAYVFHDAEVDGNVLAELTLSEIRKIVKTEVARLETILALNSHHGYYLLDLKDARAREVKSLISAVERSSIVASELVFQSDSVQVMKELQRHYPDSRYYLLDRLERSGLFYSKPKSHDILEKVTDVRIDALSVKGRKFIDSHYINELKKSGLRVFVWTINSPARALFYKNAGVDGIITDRVSEFIVDASLKN